MTVLGCATVGLSNPDTTPAPWERGTGKGDSTGQAGPGHPQAVLTRSAGSRAPGKAGLSSLLPSDSCPQPQTTRVCIITVHLKLTQHNSFQSTYFIYIE